MKLFKMLLIGFATFLFVGCGSGGTNNSIQDPTDGKVVITDENKEDVFLATIKSITGFTRADILTMGTNTSLIAKTIPNKSMNIASTDPVAVTPVSETQECSENGEVIINGDDVSGTITFKQCIQKISDPETGDVVVSLNGVITYNISGDIASFGITNFSLSIGDISAYIATAYVEVNTQTENVKIKVTGSITLKGDSIEYKDYIVIKEGNDYTISGMFKTSCFTKWLEVKTLQPLVFDPNSDIECPTGGILETKGGGDSTVKSKFKTDGSVDIYFDDEKFDSYSCGELSLIDCN